MANDKGPLAIALINYVNLKQKLNLLLIDDPRKTLHHGSYEYLQYVQHDLKNARIEFENSKNELGCLMVDLWESGALKIEL